MHLNDICQCMLSKCAGSLGILKWPVKHHEACEGVTLRRDATHVDISFWVSLEALELFPSNQDCLNASMRLNLCELICFKSLKNLQELDGKSKWNRHNRAKSATHFRDVHGCSWMCICRVPGRLSAQVIYKKCPEAVNGGLCRTIDRGTGSRWGQPYTCRPKDKFPGLPEGWESCGRVFDEYLWCISLQIRFNCPAAATKSYSTVGQNVDPHLSC